MSEHITAIDLKILSMYATDYNADYSIKEITDKLGINYSNGFKRVKILAEKEILLIGKQGQANRIKLNLNSIEAIQLISFVEEQESSKLRNTNLIQITKEAILIDPLVCIGLFGSSASGTARKDSDWDLFAITEKKIEISKLMSKFPFMRNIHLQVFNADEFKDNLVSAEEHVVKHIIRNKRIIHNPYPFYGIIYYWEKVKNAPKSRGKI